MLALKRPTWPDDIAVVNLLCAESLPGAEQLSVTAATAALSEWAARVASETDRYLYKFRQTPPTTTTPRPTSAS